MIYTAAELTGLALLEADKAMVPEIERVICVDNMPLLLLLILRCEKDIRCQRKFLIRSILER